MKKDFNDLMERYRIWMMVLFMHKFFSFTIRVEKDMEMMKDRENILIVWYLRDKTFRRVTLMCRAGYSNLL